MLVSVTECGLEEIPAKLNGNEVIPSYKPLGGFVMHQYYVCNGDTAPVKNVGGKLFI